MTALVVVGMSVTDVDRRDLLLDAARDRGGSVAFLQLADPSLSAELTRLADAGAATITLVGVSTGPIAPGHSWLRRIAAHWWRERAGLTPTIEVATGLSTGLGDLDDLLQEVRPITGTEAGLTSEAWEHVSPHRHQVLVCRGPRCTAQDQLANVRALVLALMEHDLGDDDVLLVPTGCQFPCNQAPVISIQPDDVWYGAVDPLTSRRIVAEHLVGGEPVADHRLPRRTARKTITH